VNPRRRSSDTKLIAGAAGGRVRRILLVEDNHDIQEMIATALRGQGYEVEGAALPDEGLDRLRKGRYDLVIAHYDLPGRTAAEMLTEASAEGTLKATPALIVTAHPEPKGVDESSLVRKPLDLTRFLLQIQRIFEPARPPAKIPVPDRRRPRVQLVLYVDAVWVTSVRAQENLEKVLAGFDRSQVHLRICDVAREPLDAEKDQIVFTPTLVKRSPAPRAWVVGDLSDHDVVTALLEMCGLERRGA